MVQTLLQPQEIEVFYILPTLRNQLALAMKAHGLKQRQIADYLQIAPAAVSQYIHDKRGSKVEFSKPILEEVKKSSQIITDKLTLLREMQRLIRLIKQSGEMCKIHKQLSPIPQDCSPELISCFGGDSHARDAEIPSR